MNTQTHNQTPLEDRNQTQNKSMNMSHNADQLSKKVNQSFNSQLDKNIPKKENHSLATSKGHQIPTANNNSDNSNKQSNTKKIILFIIPLIIVLLAGLAVILISQKQKTEPGPKAPTAPESKPEAQIEGTGCTLYFDVQEPVEPTSTPTSTPTATPTATPVPEPNSCGYTPCTDDDDCLGSLICATTAVDDNGDGNMDNYCSMTNYIEACQENPSYATCCTAPATPTATPSPTSTPSPTLTGTPRPSKTPTNTPTTTPVPPTNTPIPTATPAPNGPQTYVVQTETGCNSPCTVNSDCDNLSHICYNGRCRLDVNPEDEYCRLPSGETTVERIIEQPISGPVDTILQNIRIGLGAVGAALLLILFL